MTEDDNNFEDEFSDEIDFDYDEDDDDCEEWDETGSTFESEGLSGGEDSVSIEIKGGKSSPIPRNHYNRIESEFERLKNKFNYYDTPYKPWMMEDFIQFQFIEKSKELQKHQLPNCSIDDILIMLTKYNLQEEKLVSAYYDFRENFMNECGLPSDKYSDNDKKKVDDIGFETNNSNFICPICCEEETETYSLSCNHKYCCKCYSRYILDAIKFQKDIITCPGCKLSIPISDMCQIIGIKTDLSGYQFFLEPLARKYLDKYNQRFRWCPAPDCISFVELKTTENGSSQKDNKSMNLQKVPIVTCSNNHEFCFSCKYENHLPCPCVIADTWIKKCKDDSETANWIQANSQPCPQCGLNIEKNGGCNHMTCGKCKEDFCWICLGSWSTHSLYYQCNRFDPKELEAKLKKTSLKRQSLQRYLHFYKRFSIHESSMTGDARTLVKVEEKMRKYLKDRKDKENISWVDVQFLEQAIKQLTNGRKTLKWTYAFTFYLGSSNFAEIIEDMQDYLNQSVEALLKIFEQLNDKENKDASTNLIMKNQKKIKNLSGLIALRQEKLIESAYSGLNLGLLKFE